MSFRPQIPAPAPNQTYQIEDSLERETGNAGDLERYSALQIPSCAFRLPPRHSAFCFAALITTDNGESITRAEGAFTLVELTAVILIIAILAGLLFTGASSMLNRAKNTQAKNDLTQLVSAINGFYTDYGQYPVAAQSGNDSADYVGAADANGAAVMDALRNFTPPSGTPPPLNPRGIVFLSAPVAKSTTTPIGGIGTTTRAWYDPWGSAYRIKIDNNYNGLLANPYTANGGPTSLNLGCIAWSLGKNKLGGSGDKNAANNLDDILSWQ